MVAAHHKAGANQNDFNKVLYDTLTESIPAPYRKYDIPIHINAAGDFICGGPAADTGLTGRKIIVDTYGGWARHGGGAFSGKDASKVDRSGSYMARHMAKSVVASGLAKECEVQLAYVIGKKEPVSVQVDTCQTGIVSDKEIRNLLMDSFDLSVSGIIEYLDLRKPVFRQVACYGHFGRDTLELSWEKIKKLK